MKIILSPAKSLNFETCKLTSEVSTPQFIENSEYLVGKLNKFSKTKIQKLMHVSEDIAQLNYNRFQNWSFPFDKTARQALFVFNGEAYRGLDAESLSDDQLKIANDKLRILSGLYGLLKPFDLMLPYRLEMGTSLKVTSKKTNLYKYWGNELTAALNQEMQEGEVLVNVASNEYNKAIDFSKLKGEVVTCSFKEERNGTYKAIMTFAKRARGLMTRYIIENDIEEKEHLKGFDLDDYSFNSQQSSESEYVFTR